MEFIIVQGKKKTGEFIKSNIPVLINGEANGKTLQPIKLDSGIVEISLAIAGAVPAMVTVENTTATQPLKVVINIDAPKVKKA